tara:strand:+ start:240 stop:419 length:180 start_codon:yes stop_codon:yes gene_type:complete
MKTAIIKMTIEDENFTYGKRVFCSIRYEEVGDGWCDVYFGQKTKPSMQLHIEDIRAHSA